MDQDTSKTPGKGSWRDRLGIGAGNREMPKLSGEFGRDGQNGTASSESTPRGPQIVTKTAPMAPRTPAAVQDKSSDRRAERRPPPGNQQQGDNQDLAMRLKAQREAAEKVAHQRVSQARGRGERGGSEKPRFSFAEEEVAQARRETTPARDRGDSQPSFANKLAAANQTVTAGQPGARSTGPSAGPTLQSSKSVDTKTAASPAATASAWRGETDFRTARLSLPVYAFKSADRFSAAIALSTHRPTRQTARVLVTRLYRRWVRAGIIGNFRDAMARKHSGAASTRIIQKEPGTTTINGAEPPALARRPTMTI